MDLQLEFFAAAFRVNEARTLRLSLETRQSLLIIGIKRVGISNFLWHFLKSASSEKLLQSIRPQLIVDLDLNKLVDREIYPFWSFLLKRLCELCTKERVGAEIADQARTYFEESIKLRDLQVIVDNIRFLLDRLTQRSIMVTIILNRFDRLWDVATPALLTNLSSLRDISNDTLALVLTSFRPLTYFPKLNGEQLAFLKEYYFKPATDHDTQILIDAFAKKFAKKIKPHEAEALIRICGGHAQYVRILVGKGLLADTKESFTQYLSRCAQDEEVQLMSEELFKTLSGDEQKCVTHIAHGELISPHEFEKFAYLAKSGFLSKTPALFSPLLQQYVKNATTHKSETADFTKKEKLLMDYLRAHESQVCERDGIIDAVWPQQAEAGVSDWAIDRLIARVRLKLKKQRSTYEIVTVITRGYKLIRKV